MRALLARFVEALPQFEAKLAKYTQDGNKRDVREARRSAGSRERWRAVEKRSLNRQDAEGRQTT